MKQTRQIMDMPVSIEVVDSFVEMSDFEKIFSYFIYIDETFSTFKESS
jgi:ssDNA-specific exonuclease RecJ